jgi:KDO2-lipid IV(A) lauroyltransferase
MDRLLYWLIWLLIKGIQSLPLLWVARLGRALGAVAYVLDRPHRRVALQNLTNCFGAEMTPREIKAIARENFRRLGESYCCAVKTADMTSEQLRPHLEFVGLEVLFPEPYSGVPPRRVVAIGHFGNFELYARFAQFIPGGRVATTYRALHPPALNDLLQQLRNRSQSLFFERRTEAAALKAAMAQPGILLGLLVDQHAGKGGVWVPFFGRECATSSAPAVFSLRYDAPLHTGICYRVGLAKWRIEGGPEIPTRIAGEPRPVADITTDINRAFEAAVRRDPANWFWVHKRWKPRPARVREPGAAQPTERPVTAPQNVQIT